MNHEITIVGVDHSESSNHMSVVRTKVDGKFGQAMSVEKERAEKLKALIGKPLSSDEFFDALTEAIVY